MKRLVLLNLFCLLSLLTVFGQDTYWQQKAQYFIEIDFDDQKHQFKGKQQLTYINHSPDTLRQVYFHLYLNAFQPGSMMDVRSRNITDPDSRIVDRISKLSVDEIGYHHLHFIKQGKEKLQYVIEGTVMRVILSKPIAPNEATIFNMEYDSQVPVQIRRSGRNNKEGVAYSMSQWYPKIAEYDKDGWHPDPYIGREFHGVWSDFDVKIKIDRNYILGGTGVLQNAQSIGYGYEDSTLMLQLQQGERFEWHFKAENVHDFVWAADKNYAHTMARVPDGPLLHFLFLKDSINYVNWNKLRKYTIKSFQIMKGLYGDYPYPQYSVIQGGDGGMEYPMATLITAGKKLGPLVSVTVHESAHSWFQGMLATNEAKYAWMDEGFTSYAQQLVMDSIFDKEKSRNPFKKSYDSYFRLVESGLQEPLSTHADHFSTNAAYGSAAYSMGTVFLSQLGYIIGMKSLNEGMKTYFETWKFRHPDPDDFKRIMEKQSGIELDWYFNYWINSTKTIDYGIEWVERKDNQTVIYLEKLGEMPMPLDLEIRLKEGKTLNYNIPLRMMNGHKTIKNDDTFLLDSWPWTYNHYAFEIDVNMDEIELIQVDPSERMADVDRSNNSFPNNKVVFRGKLKK